MREHIRKNFGRYLLCLLLMTVGIAAFVTATAVDVDYWRSVAKTDMAKLEYGGGAVIFRSVTFLFACVVALQWRQGTVGGAAMGGLAALVLLSFASVGMTSIVGFGARERLVPYTQAMADAEAQNQAFADAKARKLKLEDDQIAFLRDQARHAKGVQSRQTAYDALGSATFGTTSVIAAPKVAMASDPQAEAIHSLFPNWSIQAIQLVTTFAFGIGLIVAEMMCMGFSVGLWPRYVKAEAVIAPEVKETFPLTAEPEPFLSAQVIHPPQFAAVKEPVAVAYEPSQLDLDVDEHLSAAETVHEFWANETRPAPGARITATPMYRAYLAWCQENDHSSTVTQQMFGRISGTICEREKGASWVYVNRALLRISDARDETDALLVA